MNWNQCPRGTPSFVHHLDKMKIHMSNKKKQQDAFVWETSSIEKLECQYLELKGDSKCGICKYKME